MRKIGVSLIIVMLLSCNNQKARILIIGDSISNGYFPFVQQAFTDRAVVVHNEGNARHTGIGLEKIDEWIGDEEWDIIQFNWGLHDLCYRHPDSKVYGNRDKIKGTLAVTLCEYTVNLDSLVRFMRATTDARLVFVTTSYVPEYEYGRFREDVPRYNAVAIKVMQNYSVLVNDIYEISMEIHTDYCLDTNDVHFTKEGYEELSKPIIKVLEEELERINL